MSGGNIRQSVRDKATRQTIILQCPKCGQNGRLYEVKHDGQTRYFQISHNRTCYLDRETGMKIVSEGKPK